MTTKTPDYRVGPYGFALNFFQTQTHRIELLIERFNLEIKKQAAESKEYKILQGYYVFGKYDLCIITKVQRLSYNLYNRIRFDLFQDKEENTAGLKGEHIDDKEAWTFIKEQTSLLCYPWVNNYVKTINDKDLLHAEEFPIVAVSFAYINTSAYIKKSRCYTINDEIRIVDTVYRCIGAYNDKLQRDGNTPPKVQVCGTLAGNFLAVFICGGNIETILKLILNIRELDNPDLSTPERVIPMFYQTKTFPMVTLDTYLKTRNDIKFDPNIEGEVSGKIFIACLGKGFERVQSNIDRMNIETQKIVFGQHDIEVDVPQSRFQEILALQRKIRTQNKTRLASTTTFLGLEYKKEGNEEPKKNDEEKNDKAEPEPDDEFARVPLTLDCHFDYLKNNDYSLFSLLEGVKNTYAILAHTPQTAPALEGFLNFLLAVKENNFKLQILLFKLFSLDSQDEQTLKDTVKCLKQFAKLERIFATEDIEQLQNMLKEPKLRRKSNIRDDIKNMIQDRIEIISRTNAIIEALEKLEGLDLNAHVDELTKILQKAEETLIADKERLINVLKDRLYDAASCFSVAMRQRLVATFIHEMTMREIDLTFGEQGILRIAQAADFFHRRILKNWLPLERKVEGFVMFGRYQTFSHHRFGIANYLTESIYNIRQGWWTSVHEQAHTLYSLLDTQKLYEEGYLTGKPIPLQEESFEDAKMFYLSVEIFSDIFVYEFCFKELGFATYLKYSWSYIDLPALLDDKSWYRWFSLLRIFAVFLYASSSEKQQEYFKISEEPRVRELMLQALDIALSELSLSQKFRKKLEEILYDDINTKSQETGMLLRWYRFISVLVQNYKDIVVDNRKELYQFLVRRDNITQEDLEGLREGIPICKYIREPLRILRHLMNMVQDSEQSRKESELFQVVVCAILSYWNSFLMDVEQDFIRYKKMPAKTERT